MAGDLERIFTNGLGGVMGNPSKVSIPDGIPNYAEDDETYQADVAAMIDDALDFEESSLAPAREENTRYFYGLEPDLSTGVASDGSVYDSSDTSAEDPDAPSKSTVVSTDVQDTIMAIMPELMRIFAGSEHAVDFLARSEEGDDGAKQATDYIRYKFWEDNQGFLILYEAIMDCLQNKIGIITWWTEDRVDVKTQTYQNISMDQIGLILSESEGAEIVQQDRPDPQTGLVGNVAIKFQKSMPDLVVTAVPPDEFRVGRSTNKLKHANLIGREQYLRAGDLIALGYDPEVVYMFAGDSRPYNLDRELRNPFESFGEEPLNDLVRYGDYFIRIDRDGDGIPELRRICTLGQNHFIIDDTPVSDANYSVFSPSPRQHTLIGNAIADLGKDIQRINTNLIRGALDSLAQSINPRTAINETLTNVEDAMNEDLGAIIRTRGNPSEAVYPIIIPFVGADAFTMKSQMDLIRQQRTGISQASQGIDPKALQSTAVMGIDLIANGAQARIELIARIIAETGLAPMYRGLLREVVNNQNQPETVKLRGKWVQVNPSTFDADMRCVVNPALGKGSDMTRLMALQEVGQKQMMVIDKFGLNNGFVTVEHVRNTIVDTMAIANIRNVSRYFSEITPELLQSIATAPKEPDPATLLAQAELEKTKKDIVVTQAKLEQQEVESLADDDFRRDKLNVDATLELVGIMAEFLSATIPPETEQITSMNQPG